MITQENTQKPNIDFIGIGVNKAATSWIFECLKDHPGICVSNPKEVNFFNWNYEKGFSWYTNAFAHCEGEKIIGEYSPNYLHDSKVPERIYNHYPDAKLIVCLREPIDRMLSAFYYNLERGKHGYKTIEEHLEIPEAWEGLVEKGFYHKHLSRYLKYFSEDQILVLFYEDIKKNPAQLIKHVYQFLGVNTEFIPSSLAQKVNMTAKNRMRIPLLNRVIYTVRNRIRKSRFKSIIMRILGILGVRALIRNVVKWNLRKNKGHKKNLQPLTERRIKQETYSRLHKLYSEDIENLEKLTERDLSRWKTNTNVMTY